MTTEEQEFSRQYGSGAEQYGRFYWCIKTRLSEETGEIYAYADRVLIDQGSLVLLYTRDGQELPGLVLAAGAWQAVYAASVLDGHAVAVEHWEGEIQR